MSIIGITYDNQSPTAADHGALFGSVHSDGILDGASISYLGDTVTIAAGRFMSAGRLCRLPAAETITVDATSGVARILLQTDLTQAAAVGDFQQLSFVIQTAETVAALPALITEDVNSGGTVYQMMVCIVAVSEVGVTGVIAVAPASTTVITAGAVTMNSLAPEVQRRFFAVNLLDNSDFRNPVNQRRDASYSGSKYTIDRWRLWNSGHTATIDSNGLTVTGGNLVQYIMSSVFKDGVKYTYAAKDSSGNLYVGIGDANTPIALGGISGFEFDESRNSYNFSLGPNHTWVWAALYEGEYTADTLPEYIPKGYGAELAECQRYYQRFGKLGSSTNIAVGRKMSNESVSASLNLPVPMRMNPNATITSGSYIGSNAMITGISSCDLTNNILRISFVCGASELVYGTAYNVVLAASSVIELNADL